MTRKDVASLVLGRLELCKQNSGDIEFRGARRMARLLLSDLCDFAHPHDQDCLEDLRAFIIKEDFTRAKETLNKMNDC